MHEGQILDIVDSLTLGTLSNDEKSKVVADIKFELSGKRFAGGIINLVMNKLEDLSNGMYREAQALPKTFQDFSEKGENLEPFKVDTSEIDKFLEKMISKDNTDDPFTDTHPFYHPPDNMKAEGQPISRSNFVVQS